jgi:hypothetical protein
MQLWFLVKKENIAAGSCVADGTATIDRSAGLVLLTEA